MDESGFKLYLDLLDELEFSQLRELRREVDTKMSADEIAKAIADREETVSSCHYCGSRELKKWGQTKKHHQRFKCKTCDKTFSTLTGTAIFRLRNIDKWVEHAELLEERLPLRTVAKKLDIDLKTAFRWRHKYLSMLCDRKPSKLVGIVEADEAFIDESDKGKKKLSRSSRKRGGGNKETPKVPILMALDRTGAIAHFVLWSKTKVEISEKLSPLLTPDSVLCTDGNVTYQSIVKELDFEIDHKRIIAKEKKHVIDGVYHIQTLNNYIMRLRCWLDFFRGVGTEYLENYLSWFRFYEDEKRTGPKDWFREAFNLPQCHNSCRLKLKH